MRITVSMREDAIRTFASQKFKDQIEEARTTMLKCGDAVYSEATKDMNISDIPKVFTTLLSHIYFVCVDSNNRNCTEEVLFSGQRILPRGGYFYTNEAVDIKDKMDAYKEQSKSLEALKNKQKNLIHELTIHLKSVTTLKKMEEMAPEIAKIIIEKYENRIPNLPCNTFESILSKYT